MPGMYRPDTERSDVSNNCAHVVGVLVGFNTMKSV
jgi:hypothetical protein